MADYVSVGSDSFTALLDFLAEAEALKAVDRKTRPVGLKRYEKSAEHSWSLSLMALLFQDQANTDVDILKVLKMLIIHDLPEVYADDVFVYARGDEQAEKEALAADKLFGMLPSALRDEFITLWREFEEAESPEALYANSLDRFHPCFCNFKNAAFGKTSWQELGIAHSAVLKKNQRIEKGSVNLWNCLKDIVEIGRVKGFFPQGKDVKYE